MSSTTVSPGHVLFESSNNPASRKPNPLSKDKDADSRLSLSTSNVKDMRAYEHDRQKVKKAAELVKRKARNSPGWSRTLQEAKVHSPSPAALSGKHERLTVEDVDPLEELEYDVEVRRLTHSHPSRAVPRKEVKIADLITARKPRKSKDGDFEVIPHVRSVIALDEFVSGLDPSVDEPWEHIGGQFEEDDIARTHSYAEILSAGK